MFQAFSSLAPEIFAEMLLDPLVSLALAFSREATNISVYQHFTVLLFVIDNTHPSCSTC
jgi:hypothetical protein